MFGKDWPIESTQSEVEEELTPAILLHSSEKHHHKNF